MSTTSSHLFIFASEENQKNNELLLLFSTYQSTLPFNGSSSFKKFFFYKVGLIIYKYSLNLLPECITHLYLRNVSIHDHNYTRGCHELRVLPDAKTFSNISARIWNVLSSKISCDVLMSQIVNRPIILIFLLDTCIFPQSLYNHILILDVCFFLTVCIFCVFTLIFITHIN